MAVLEQERIERFLSRSSVFGPLNTPATNRVVTVSELRRVDRRKSLSSPGVAALHVVGSGRVRLFRRQGDRELTLDYLGAGELLGETVLFEESPPEAVATDAVEAVRIPVGVVRELLSGDAAFAVRMLDLVGERRLIAERRIHSLLTRSVESRVAEFLLHAASRHGVPDSRGTLIGVKFTHQEIANYVGSTRETVTLILGDLKRRGLVSTEHRRVVLTDADGLSRRI